MRIYTLARVGLVVAALAFGGAARAAGAPAGAAISNTAQVSYTVGAAAATTASNTVTLTVAEILDVLVTVQTPTVTVSPAALGQALLFRVTNTGNGSETFRLSMTSVLGGDDFDPTPATPAIYFDTDGSGTLTPADTPYTAGSNDPLLAADAFVAVLLVNNIPPPPLSNGTRGFSRLTVEARTGTGAAGAVFPGAGTGGTDAVVGTSGADADGTGEYLVADIAIAALKSAAVVDPFGGSRPVPGARINYRIVVTASGSGTATNAAFTDPIPPNTTYVPGSLQLNSVALTDASDADAGSYATSPAAQLRVTLGNLAQATGAQTITFAVTIN